MVYSKSTYIKSLKVKIHGAVKKNKHMENDFFANIGTYLSVISENHAFLEYEIIKINIYYIFLKFLVFVLFGFIWLDYTDDILWFSSFLLTLSPLSVLWTANSINHDFLLWKFLQNNYF